MHLLRLRRATHTTYLLSLPVGDALSTSRRCLGRMQIGRAARPLSAGRCCYARGAGSCGRQLFTLFCARASRLPSSWRQYIALPAAARRTSPGLPARGTSYRAAHAPCIPPASHTRILHARTIRPLPRHTTPASCALLPHHPPTTLLPQRMCRACGSYLVDQSNAHSRHAPLPPPLTPPRARQRHTLPCHFWAGIARAVSSATWPCKQT